jgi:coenzyme F420-dependent glucose-6-phosphate dehydrogenase
VFDFDDAGDVATAVTTAPAAVVAPAIGFHCAHELWSPRALLDLLKRAGGAGFTVASCSDHFMPWSERNAHSGFAWSWLGAALEATTMPLGTVCAPGQRYHPAVVAQAVATLTQMYPGRFWLAVGSGEALNEHVNGAPWPRKAERNVRLRECVDIMRALWSGERVTHTGVVTVRDARLYTLPERQPLLLGAALTPETARWLGGWADGLITVSAERSKLASIVAAFRDGGGEGKPMYLQVGLAHAASDEDALRDVHDRWRQCVLPPSGLADLPTPWAFDAATAGAALDEVRGKLRVSSSIEQHVDWLLADVELGFEHLYLHNVGRDQERFIDACGSILIPAVVAGAR